MMTVRRPGFSLFGALLAFAAILGVFALSSWHSAVVDDTDPIHAVSIGQSNGRHKKADPDGPIHVVAHATASLVSIEAQPVATVLQGLADQAWLPFVTLFRAGSDPSGPLRPPQG
ncbi:hypothetical protein GCM10008023_39870 [Sphingomonas glacialis]|uniref:Uncharacterized protein n=1 Tax=Sphingomonas glacialis TaxID=658225 RepID=A0ABQ3LWH2_9SPHN|nr:hypothetical protein [Sphingomonas glacialis]GHH25937.1 hypothetical protein GCM10008023_39870 [Sphingomonas glacialis]